VLIHRHSAIGATHSSQQRHGARLDSQPIADTEHTAVGIGFEYHTFDVAGPGSSQE
jgi:hypothetical protein